MHNENKWSVYRHICPNGRMYIGMTGEKPEKRWNGGFGYESHKKFFAEIVAAGWDNIEHEVIHDNLSEEEAAKLEKELILTAILADRNAVLNTAYNPSPEKEWYDNQITTQSIERFESRFSFLDDWWMENYKNLTGSFPFNIRIYCGYVILEYIGMDNEELWRRQYRIDYPDSVITFIDLHKYLCEGKNGEWVNGQHEAILKNPKNEKEE